MPPSSVPHLTSRTRPETRSGLDVLVRPLETLADFRTCVDLQREIWGSEYDDIVPASLMRAAAHVGALTLGAFGADGVQLGFVFGITGVEQAEAVHWSHMLGVRAGARDQGVGRKLKEFQRAELLRRRIRRMYWTFDPLQARNAHLNVNRLGVRVVEYVRDMYCTSLSPLHQAVGTDRLVVECRTEVNGHGAPQHENGRLADAQVLTAFPEAGELPAPGSDPALALIEIPWDLQAVVAESVHKAAEWRAATRRYFQWALANGYEVTGVRRDEAARRVFFVIERTAASS